MRNKLNVKQKATRELEMIERKKNSTERDSMREKERKKKGTYFMRNMKLKSIESERNVKGNVLFFARIKTRQNANQ